MLVLRVERIGIENSREEFYTYDSEGRLTEEYIKKSEYEHNGFTFWNK